MVQQVGQTMSTKCSVQRFCNHSLKCLVQPFRSNARYHKFAMIGEIYYLCHSPAVKIDILLTKGSFYSKLVDALLQYPLYSTNYPKPTTSVKNVGKVSYFSPPLLPYSKLKYTEGLTSHHIVYHNVQ